MECYRVHGPEGMRIRGVTADGRPGAVHPGEYLVHRLRPKAVASGLIARLRDGAQGRDYDGFGTCYIEFGAGRIGKVQVDFFSGPKPIGTYYEPSVEHRADQQDHQSDYSRQWRHRRRQKDGGGHERHTKREGNATQRLGAVWSPI